MFRQSIPIIQAQLSIDKALEFVGDNSNYQRKRLIIIGLTVLSLAVLTNKIALEHSALSLLFLIASGAGQIIVPIYMSLRTCTLGVAASALLACGLYPFGGILRGITLLSLGFFSRGFFISGLVYLNEIGGDRFRAWAMLVIFGLWALSSVFSSIEQKLDMGRWMVYYMFVFVPVLIGAYMVLQNWQPSPMYLYLKKQYSEAKQVLSIIANENDRSHLPYDLQGQSNPDALGYCRVRWMDLLTRPYLRKISIPLCVMWVYRQYIYYTSYILIPEVSYTLSRTYLMLSLSQTVAVLLSYPIRINIKRVNATAGCIIMVLIMCMPSSLVSIPHECRQEGYTCTQKTLYFVTLMLTRFAMSLLGIVLVSYTLEVYPSNVRRLGFSVCLGISSIGSILMPWLNETLMHWELSGYIIFAIASIAALYFVPKLEETHGRMKIQTLEDVQNTAQTSLRNWALLNFSD